jgi:hypothetical protein
VAKKWQQQRQARRLLHRQQHIIVNKKVYLGQKLDNGDSQTSEASGGGSGDGRSRLALPQKRHNPSC